MVKVLGGRCFLIAIVLALLEALVRTGVINPLFMAKPSTFLSLLWREWEAVLRALSTTLYEVALTFLLAAVAGLLLGYALWRFQALGDGLEGLLGALFASPTVLLYPISLAIFGRSSNAIITMAGIVAFLPIALITRSAFFSVSPTFIEVGRSLNLSEGRIFRYILLPAAAPLVFSGLRLGVMYTLIAVVAMEFILHMGGLGRTISDAHLRFQMDWLYGGVVLVVLLTVFVLLFLGYIEGRLRR